MTKCYAVKSGLNTFTGISAPFLATTMYQFTWSLTSCGSVVHTGCHPSWFNQSQSEGQGSFGERSRILPQQYAAWNTLLRMWNIRASFVRGKSSILHPFLLKSSMRAASTLDKTLVLLYSRTVKRSTVEIVSSVSSSGANITEWKASVSLPYVFHISQAVFFPLLAKDDTVSHPVYAWNIGRTLDLTGPSERAIKCVGMYRRWRPVPYATL